MVRAVHEVAGYTAR